MVKDIVGEGENAGFERLLLNVINPFPNKPWFLRVCSTCLLKTLWEKEKLLVTSNFSFLYASQRRDVLWDHPWWAGGLPGGWAASSSLSGAYLQNYSS